MTTLNTSNVGVKNVGQHTQLHNELYQVEAMSQYNASDQLSSLSYHVQDNPANLVPPVPKGNDASLVNQKSGSSSEMTESNFDVRGNSDTTSGMAFMCGFTASRSMTPNSSINAAGLKAILVKRLTEVLTKTTAGTPNGRDALLVGDATKISTLVDGATFKLDGKYYKDLASVLPKWNDGSCANYYRCDDHFVAKFIDYIKVSINGGRENEISGPVLLMLNKQLCEPSKRDFIEMTAGKSEELNLEAVRHTDNSVGGFITTTAMKKKRGSIYSYARQHQAFSGSLSIPEFFNMNGNYAIPTPGGSNSSHNIQVTVKKNRFSDLFKQFGSLICCIKATPDTESLGISRNFEFDVPNDQTVITGVNMSTNQLLTYGETYHPTLKQQAKNEYANTCVTRFVVSNFQITSQILNMQLVNVEGYLKTLYIMVVDKNAPDGEFYALGTPVRKTYQALLADGIRIQNEANNNTGSEAYYTMVEVQEPVNFDPEVSVSIDATHTHTIKNKNELNALHLFGRGKIAPGHVIVMSFDSQIDAKGLPASGVNSKGQKTVKVDFNADMMTYVAECRTSGKHIPEILLVSESTEVLVSGEPSKDFLVSS